MPVLVQAAGELSGRAFERAQFFVLPVGSADIRLAGNISEQAVDANGDSRYSRLDIGLDIEVGSPGHYVVSAQLRRDGQPLSVATTTTNVLQPGRHRVVLGFRGADLLANGVDGPYTVADAVVIGVEHGGVPSAHAEELYITAPYRARDFTDKDASDVYMPQVLR